MTGQVEGKVALVTGGASGIGAACAELLAREGASVARHRCRRARGAEVVAGIKKAGRRGGVSASGRHQRGRAGWRWWPRLKSASAGSTSWCRMPASASSVPSITEMSLEDWRRQTAINLDGVFLSVKHCLPAMRRSGGGGSIVMMSSLAGLRGAPGLAGYCATKGGVRLFAKAIAMECASAGDGIRVNSVHPGIIDTPIWGKIPTEATGRGQNAPIDPEERAKLATPLGRAGHASEIAARRAVSGVRCLELRDRHGTRHRRRHERGRRGAEGVDNCDAVDPSPPFRASYRDCCGGACHRAALAMTGKQSAALPQPRQHLQPAIAVGGLQPRLHLIIPDRLHGVVADAAVGAAGVEAGLGQPRPAFPALRPASARARSPGTAG